MIIRRALGFVLLVALLALVNTSAQAQGGAASTQATSTSSPRRTTQTGLAGVKEFFTSGTFTVPTGINGVRVQMWGGGGGGGAPSQCFIGASLFSGPGVINVISDGGGGAYTDTVVAVTAGVTYTVTVGSGGLAATSEGANGGNGGDSQFALGSTVLAFVGGGQGGPVGGGQGAGGAADGNALISHSGHKSGTGEPLFCSVSTCALTGGAPYASNLIPDEYIPKDNFSFAPQLGFGAQAGSCFPVFCDVLICGGQFFPGPPGNPGYVLLTF